MLPDPSADTRDSVRGGVALRAWLVRGKYLLFEVVALAPLFAAVGFCLRLVSAFSCMAPGSEPEDSVVVHVAWFDPVIPFTVMVIAALTTIAVWGAYRDKPMVWKTQAVLALIVVIAAMELHDPHPTCTRETTVAAATPAGHPAGWLFAVSGGAR